MSYRRYSAAEARISIAPYGSRLLVRWQSDAHFHAILASFRAALPRHGDCCYNGTHRAWSVSPYARDRLVQWLWLTFEPGCVQWLNEEPGTTGSASGRYGQPQTSTSVEAAFATLHLLPSAPPWAAEAVYRAAIKVHHPDAGGDGQTMTRINLAMETIREQRWWPVWRCLSGRRPGRHHHHTWALTKWTRVARKLIRHIEEKVVLSSLVMRPPLCLFRRR